MLQEERYQRLRSLLANFGQLTTERIATDMNVSRETVRRDVLELEALGELRRVHGGVVATTPEPEPPLDERTKVHLREKRSIARAAAKLVKPGQTVLMEGGSSTVLALAEELASLSGLNIVTNSFHIAHKLSSLDGAGPSRHDVIVLGGRLVGAVGATFGEITVAEVHRYMADWTFLSPVGLHPEHGATSYEHREAAVAQAMRRRARHTAIMADHSKLGQVSRVSYCAAKEIDVLITTHQARTQAALQALKRSVRDVIVS